MLTQLEYLIDHVERAKTFEDLLALIWKLRDAFEIENAVYHSVNRKGEPYALTTYNTEWANHYEQEELFKIDPVVIAAYQRFHPYEWKSLNWGRKPVKKFFFEAVESGVGNQGLSLPIRGPNGEFALFTVSHQCIDSIWVKFIEHNRSALLLVGHYLHQAARRIEHSDVEQIYTNLSPREADALSMLGAGLNRARVAERLTISEHTLRVYIESARFKLGAANTTHAVAKAMSQGLIAL